MLNLKKMSVVELNGQQEHSKKVLESDPDAVKRAEAVIALAMVEAELSSRSYLTRKRHQNQK